METNQNKAKTNRNPLTFGKALKIILIKLIWISRYIWL